MTASMPVILVVEDDLALLQGIRDLLELAGYRVVLAENGQKALDRLREAHVDLIISDIMMPVMDGYELYREVRRRPELLELPFIFLTARADRSDVRRGKALGVDDYVTKPFEEEDLLVAVRSKLERWRELRTQRDVEVADLKRAILTALSHEFRTPLTYVVNYAELLDEEAMKQEEFGKFMAGIRKGARRLHQLVEDFITLVEFETGEAETAYLMRRREIQDPSGWLQSVADRFRAQVASRNLEFKVEIPEGLPPLLADTTYLEDAIRRLVDNALKFSRPESSWVRLAAAVQGEKLRIEVQDQGIGIRKGELGSLFNVFHQIDRAKREQQGTGSGLAICQRIAEVHGGRVLVDSQYGEGSTFALELPLRGPGPHPTDPAP